MGANEKFTKKYSFDHYWIPEESTVANHKIKEHGKREKLRVPDLSTMIENWRNERGDLLKKKEQQKKKLQLKREKYLARNKIAADEKNEYRKSMEIALQNTLKTKDNSNLLLAELDELDAQISEQFADTRESLETPFTRENDYPFLKKNEYACHNTKSDETLLFKKNHQTTLKLQEMTEASSNITINSHSSKYFVYKKAIEDVFLQLKEQQEHFLYSSRAPREEKDIFKESHNILKDVYNEEMKILNTQGVSSQSIQFTYKAFPPFPSSIKELDFLSGNPLIIFREWCHFHLLSPIPNEKITFTSLLNDYINPEVNNRIRLLSLCTLMQLYSERQLITKESQESELKHSSGDGPQLLLKEQSNELEQALHNTLKNTHGKLKLGTALALALMGRTNENKDAIAATLISAMKGITTTERRIAALAMAHAGIFENTVLHILLEEWKGAQHAHTLYKYLTGLRWLSIHESSVIKSVAENLSSEHLYFRLCICLTIPFLEGNLPKCVKDTLNSMVHTPNIYFLRLAAARVLECKGHGDCVHRYITSSLSSSNILRAFEVIQLSLMLKWIDPRIAGILLPCLNSDINYVKTVGLNIIEKLHLNNPIFVEAVNNLTIDKDSEIREAAFITLGEMGVTASQVQSVVLSAVVTENNEKVLKAILKLIERTRMKGKALHKALQKVYSKEQNKDDQQLLLNLLDSTNLEENKNYVASGNAPTEKQDTPNSQNSEENLYFGQRTMDSQI